MDQEPTKWLRVQALFEQAVALPEEERAALLQRVTDADVREELHRLLQHDASATDPAERVVAAAAGWVQPSADRLVGARLGPWRLDRHLADGGMGAVYLATRADGQFEQRAAVKLLNPALTSPQFAQRLALERQILARLQHPNVAALLDGGTTDDGAPYLVMEFVDGLPIDHHCRQLGLDTAARLRLMQQVCNAVEHAHRNLVVHRDLKPANILVDTGGQVKPLDFGVAKLVEDDASLATRADQRLLTPHYASPEQLRGEPVTTATDIYALGVLLYELLYELPTGRPLILRTPPHPPPAPSWRARSWRPSRVGPAACCRRLRALARRHRARAGLGGAQGHAQGPGAPLPVSAHAGRGLAAPSAAPPGDRARRLGGLPAGQVRAPASRGRVGHCAGAEHGAGRRRRVHAAAERAALRVTIGRAFLGLGLYAQAQGQFERALGTIELRRDALPEAMALLERALDGTRRIYGDEHLRVAYLRANLGPVHYQTGDYARAEALTRQAMPVFERRLGAEHPRTAFLMENLANAVLALGRHDEALGLYQRSIELLRRKLGPDHVEMGHSAGNMAGVYARLNRHADMLPCSLESVRVLEKALGADTPRRLIGGSRRTRTCSRRAALTTPTPAPQRAACRKCSSGWGPAEAWPATARGASGPLIAPRPGPGSARGCGV